MKTITLKNTGLFWDAACDISSKLEREIYWMDILKWKKLGFKVVFINGIFGDGQAIDLDTFLEELP